MTATRIPEDKFAELIAAADAAKPTLRQRVKTVIAFVIGATIGTAGHALVVWLALNVVGGLALSFGAVVGVAILLSWFFLNNHLDSVNITNRFST